MSYVSSAKFPGAILWFNFESIKNIYHHLDTSWHKKLLGKEVGALLSDGDNREKERRENKDKNMMKPEEGILCISRIPHLFMKIFLNIKKIHNPSSF